MSSTISKYDPIQGAIWKQKEAVPYKAVASLLDEVEKIGERNRIISLTANLFRSIIATTPDDLLPTVYLLINQVAPSYEGLELGIGDGIIIKAIQEATGKSSASIKSELKKHGDLGDVAMTCKSTQRLLFPPPPLTVRGLFKDFLSLAQLEGNSTQSRKVGVIKRLLVSAHGSEIKFLVRGLQGKLRVGLAEQSVLAALAHAVVLTPPSATLPPPVLDASLHTNPAKLQTMLSDAVETVKQALSECPSYDKLIPAVLQAPLSQLNQICHLTPGIPVHPMLAKPTKGISEVLDRLQGRQFTCEFKYDGERAQIHRREDGTIKIFSRNNEDNTSKYPDLVKALQDCVSASVGTFIVDSECVAWDREAKRILPFQILSTRARKEVKEEEVKIHVVIFAFDLLFLNGESLIQKPLRERRALLRENFKEVEGKIHFASFMDDNDTEKIQAFLLESVANGCEGLMIKTLEENATYEPSKRSLNWLKLKKDYLQDLGDSMDLVPIGGYYGKGKRTGNFGAFLLACFDESSEEFQSICKVIGTGFSDDALKQYSEFFSNGNLLDHKLPIFNVNPSVEPDVWLNPVQVWEVRAADLSISPVHTAAIGLVDADKGIALRFPRFVRIREDKKPEEATTAEQVVDFYKSQANVSGANE
ncbi:uncharacterized protein [Blastocystis hominis]|uniref:DNA ligase n=1 Tax=Blastocystis hominis TaxID=12968 RepID=D8M844_BLAHO|nr:uncharacterized protein [Blastocystis hominis]CBK24233.2 unnamed protein product [Blastocystis hominis]|eukprot:XP_012898281.1 uncharacterized protein [Blastocystis hominis]